MKSAFLSLCCIILTTTINAQAPSHKLWDDLLQKYVSPGGEINYQGISNNRIMLDSYLQVLKTNHPAESWNKSQKMVYWINAYNAFTVKLILDHYPLKSINDIKKDGEKPWDIPFIKIGKKVYTLNNIEHDILRKEFTDPRIHFAVNCASYSCPPLMNKAFTEQNLNTKLDLLAKQFINDPKRNKITSGSILVSQIFNWFKDDFTKKGTLIDFLNKYANTKISSGAKVGFMEYNWSLNDKL